jgi:S-(hydroxymethyl)glutathione dehydrogenase / alcohol dehydrogenase
MKAAILWQSGGQFDVRDGVHLIEPSAHEVVVDLHSAGLCASDTMLANTPTQRFPMVLGHEGAGIVSEVGSAVTSVVPGNHVIIDWISPCGMCRPCVRGQEYLCASRRSTDQTAAAGDAQARLTLDGQPIAQGMNAGTFAQRTLVPERSVIKIDKDVPFDIAAFMGCAVPTGVGAALRSARVSHGDHVAVIGCGAVGMNAILGAVVAGASRVVAVDPFATRRSLALEIGATDAVEPSGLDAFAATLDVVIDAVGKPATIRSGWDAVRRGGTVTVVGAAGRNDEVIIPGYQLFHDDKRLTGSFLGGMSLRRDLTLLVELWRAGRLPLEKLLSGSAPLEEINEIGRAQQSGEVLRRMLTVRA